MSNVSPIKQERKKKSAAKKKAIVLLSVFICLAYIFLHVMTVMRTDKRADINQAFSQGLENAYKAPLELIVKPSDILYMVGALAAVIVVIMSKQADKELRKHDNPDTVNGEAHFMNTAELEEFHMKFCDPIGKPEWNNRQNIILSKDIQLSLKGSKVRRNAHILVIGGSGAGKSRFFIAPNILQFNTNYIITDPSGELYNEYARALELNGYQVLVFNTTDAYRSHRYNPFYYITCEKDVFVLVNTLIRNTTPPDAHAGDPIWENGEKLLLEAIILYLWHTAPIEKQTMDTVLQMLNLAEIDENDATVESPLDILFNKLEKTDPENLAVKSYKRFKLAAGKTLKSFLISVATRLQIFDEPGIKRLTSVDDLHLETFADSKKALFVVTSSVDTTFNFMAALMYSQIFQLLFLYAETTKIFGWKITGTDDRPIRVFRAASKEESKQAQTQAEALLKEAKKGLNKVYNEMKGYWEAQTKDGEVIAWNGDEEQIKAFIASAKYWKVEKTSHDPNDLGLPNHVQLLLDEFANIGQIPGFTEKLSVMRKYRISCAIVLQTLSQLKVLYKDSWNTIVGNCDTKLFLGCDDSETQKWLSEMLGKRTTTVENTSYQAGPAGNGSTSYNKGSGELLSIDRLALLNDSECIVRIRGVRPYFGPKYELTDHPNYKTAISTASEFEIPLSKEAEEYRAAHSGPLQKRLKNRSMQDETMVPAEKETEETSSQPETVVKTQERKSEPKPSTRQEYQESNNKRKQKAAQDAGLPIDHDTAIETAEKILKNDGPMNISEQDAENLLSAFGLDANSTEEQMIEAMESVLIFETVPSTTSTIYGVG